jgi:hypothetical protein
MPRFIEKDRDKLTGSPAEKSIEDHHFWNRIVGAARVTANASGRTRSGKKDDRVATELNIGLKGISLCVREGGITRG